MPNQSICFKTNHPAKKVPKIMTPQGFEETFAEIEQGLSLARPASLPDGGLQLLPLLLEVLQVLSISGVGKTGQTVLPPSDLQLSEDPIDPGHQSVVLPSGQLPFDQPLRLALHKPCAVYGASVTPYDMNRGGQKNTARRQEQEQDDDRDVLPKIIDRNFLPTEKLRTPRPERHPQEEIPKSVPKGGHFILYINGIDLSSENMATKDVWISQKRVL